LARARRVNGERGSRLTVIAAPCDVDHGVQAPRNREAVPSVARWRITRENELNERLPRRLRDGDPFGDPRAFYLVVLAVQHDVSLRGDPDRPHISAEIGP
jgi:hypothetical protein